MKVRKSRYFVGDFETTVYKGQVRTEVWASASVEMFTEDVHIFHSIEEQFDYFVSLNCNIICYYHNLKFDGAFWLSFLLTDLGWQQAYEDAGSIETLHFIPPKDMKNNTFSYSISNMGQWYRITIKVRDKIIELRDSLKLLPFSVKKIGQSFGTKHKKLDIEYEGIRYAGCVITEEEQRYIANDVLVVKEALEKMFTEGHKKLTIGSCCLAEYKKILGHKTYEAYFPNIYDMPIDKSVYGSDTAGEYIRQSYHGGWCYVAKGKANRIFTSGITIDVNSLYPSMMSGESLNVFPVGKPTFWVGDSVPKEAQEDSKYYFVRIRTRFKLREGKLPFVQIKNNLMYKPTEMLTTSDIYDARDGKYYRYYKDFDESVQPATITMTLTKVDFKLFLEHYDIEDFEILDGCYFDGAIGIFDQYIDKYKKIKLESKGATRELAKLFLNNLYGKLASSKNSSFKVAYVKEDKTIGFYTVIANDKEPGYIPVGSAITSYARNFTIRAAQANYYGANKRGFIYADTDSIHCDLTINELKGVRLDAKNFCCWKHESSWDVAYFTRQKTYIEHITEEDGVPIDTPYYNIKCAGMPEKSKKLFRMSLTGKINEEEFAIMSDEEKEFALKKRDINDFTIGLKVPGKLLPKRIQGGVVLVDTYYEMR